MRKQTEDIAPLVDIVDAEFRRLLMQAHTATNELATFWTRLYGPNEVADNFREVLNGLDDEWNGEQS